MSSFSYISFPREVDISSLQSKVDESKMSTIGEIRGTEFDTGCIENLPDHLNVYLGDFADFHGIQIFDRGEAEFDNVFTNKYIYSFQAAFKFNDAEEDDIINKIFGNHNDNAALCRRQLYDIVKKNIRPNEVVEIFTGLVDGIKFDFGPPKVKIIFDLEEVHTSEMLELEIDAVIEIRLSAES